ncbi:hypothetical protein JNUCC23_09450 [Peribacillus sp. JNUCC 23]
MGELIELIKYAKIMQLADGGNMNFGLKVDLFNKLFELIQEERDHRSVSVIWDILDLLEIDDGEYMDELVKLNAKYLI